MDASKQSDRRGGVYIAVLGVTTFVTVIGVSGVLLAGVQRETAETRAEGASSRLAAQSALALALSRVAGEPAWNVAYPHKQWNTIEGAGDGEWAFMLEYDQAAADAGQSVDMTISAIVVRERAARVWAIDAIAKPGAEATQAVANGGFDSGIAGWSTTGGGNFTDDKIYYHIGPGSAWLGARPAPAAGIKTDVLPAMVNGAPFEFEAFGTMGAHKTDTWTASIYHDGGGTFQQLELATDTLSGDWGRLAGSGTISWTGSAPTTAELMIFTWSQKAQISVDTVSLRIGSASAPELEVVPGTLRQRTLR